MELGKENTNMTTRANILFEEWYLVLKIILLAEKLSHAIVVVLKWADWGALHSHHANIKPMLLEHLLQALWHACLSCHFLCFLTALNSRVVHWNYCVLLFSLFLSIAFVHIKCMKCIWPKWSMCRWVVEQEKHNVLGVCLLKNLYCLVDLCKELHMILPLVTTCIRICNAACIFHYNALLIVDDKTSILFLNEIWNMNQSPPPFLY